MHCAVFSVNKAVYSLHCRVCSVKWQTDYVGQILTHAVDAQGRGTLSFQNPFCPTVKIGDYSYSSTEVTVFQRLTHTYHLSDKYWKLCGEF